MKINKNIIINCENNKIPIHINTKIDKFTYDNLQKFAKDNNFNLETAIVTFLYLASYSYESSMKGSDKNAT